MSSCSDKNREIQEKLSSTCEEFKFCGWYDVAFRLGQETHQILFEFQQTCWASHNLMFSDECSISLQQYWCTCYRKFDEPMKRTPKPKHRLKVRVWVGISRHGAAEICIFDNIMGADPFCNILESTLVLFNWEKLPDHQFMQDNVLKHMSGWAQAFFE